MNKKGSKKGIALTPSQYKYVKMDLIRKDDYRMLVICILLYKCVRLRDILCNLTVDDLYTPSGAPRKKINIVELRSGHIREVEVDLELKNALKLYREEVNEGLFYSRQQKKISESGIKHILNQYVGKSGIVQCSPESIRKTAGVEMLSSADINSVVELFNHDRKSHTLSYLNIS